MSWTETARREYGRRSQRCSSDLTEREWALIASLIPGPRPLGRPRTSDLREVMNAILYLASGGCAWSLLPREFPPRSTVQRYFYDWRDSGVLRAINHHLVAAARDLEGRESSPTAGIIDSQSVKTTENGGVRGFDAGKKIKGRQRHILTDTLGLMVGLVVHGADIQDRDGAPTVLQSVRHSYPRSGSKVGQLRSMVSSYSLQRCRGTLLSFSHSLHAQKSFPDRWSRETVCNPLPILLRLRHIFADGGYGGDKLKGLFLLEQSFFC